MWRSRLAWALAGLWFLSAAAGLWFVELRPLQAASAGALAAFDGERLARAAAPLAERARSQGRALALHFRDPRCPCSRFTSEAVLSMARRGAAARVDSLLVAAPGTGTDAPWGWEAAGLGSVSDELARQLWAALPAGPAVALFDARGRLVYLGGYGSAGQCAAGSGPAFAALDRALGNAAGAEAAGGLATGCFCAPGTQRVDTALLVLEAGK